jgi:hypothetical protein
MTKINKLVAHTNLTQSIEERPSRRLKAPRRLERGSSLLLRAIKERTPERGTLELILFPGPVRAQQFLDAGSIFDARVEFEVQFGRVAQLQAPANVPANESAGTAKSFDRFGGLRATFKMGEKDLAVA